MERVLDLFLERARLDDALLKYAANRDLSSHYIASDLGPQFFLWFRDGAVQAGLGPPPERAHVRLKAKAEILDGILTGRVNGNRAAMTGKLSFSGDVRLAMGMQRIQKDLIRLYTAAREDVGGLDLAAPEQAAAAVKTIPESRAAEAPVPQATAAAPEAARAAPASIHSGASATPAADELRREVAAVAEELFAARLITPTGGNVSARVPGAERAWITPSQLFKGGLTPEMMVLVDLDGEALDPDAAAPSSERLLHTAIYKARPDVQAVIHSHGVYATILGMSELPFLPVTTEAAFFDEIPRVAFTMPGSGDLADAVREALGNGTAVLLQNHGLVVAADSLRQAANAAAAVEEACQIIWSCEAVGKHPPTLPDDVVATLREIGRMIG
jgi:autoinducer 2 (AI-2) kinase